MANMNTQTIYSFKDFKSAIPDAPDNIIDDYIAKTRLITELLNGVAPASGTGSPEGVVAAPLSKQYVDTAANQTYFNPIVGATAGWIAV